MPSKTLDGATLTLPTQEEFDVVRDHSLRDCDALDEMFVRLGRITVDVAEHWDSPLAEQIDEAVIGRLWRFLDDMDTDVSAGQEHVQRLMERFKEMDWAAQEAAAKRAKERTDA